MYECMYTYVTYDFVNLDNATIDTKTISIILQMFLVSPIFNRGAIFDTCLNVGL